MTTKKMMKDIKKLKAESIFVCNACGDDQIEEKVWASINNTAVVDGKVFHEVDDVCDDMYWCRVCNDPCNPITFEKYMEEKDAE